MPLIYQNKHKTSINSFFPQLPPDPAMEMKLRALQIRENDLKNTVAELERREAAYLEMLTQADDMWAEMEGGYKKKIQEAHSSEAMLKEKVRAIIFTFLIIHQRFRTVTGSYLSI